MTPSANISMLIAYRMNPFYSSMHYEFETINHRVCLVTKLYLKLVSAIFYQNFVFSPNDNPLKAMKNVM